MAFEFLDKNAREVAKKIKLRQAQEDWETDCEAWRARIQMEIRNAKPLREQHPVGRPDQTYFGQVDFSKPLPNKLYKKRGWVV